MHLRAMLYLGVPKVDQVFKIDSKVGGISLGKEGGIKGMKRIFGAPR